MGETFGPEYVRPAQRDCPRCGCCTAALCERGRGSVMRCYGLTSEEHRATVEVCPCSAETTKHTASWRSAQIRVTRLAREKPLSEDVEEFLRSMAAGVVPDDPDDLYPQLQVRGLGQLVHGLHAITPLGHTYLAARDDVRTVVAVKIVDIDVKARTARVEVAAWRLGEPVTVLLDQIVTDARVDAESLPGMWLDVEANCRADSADRLVLTHFRKPVQLPQGWVRASGRGE
ncbi:hypothetical protein ACFTTN_14310 [Streptomyces niveus]|uniref:hypothetical protein n=1 Tax=Streptomyces niveus TaxID=193462 RepID=UPI003631309E